MSVTPAGVAAGFLSRKLHQAPGHWLDQERILAFAQHFQLAVAGWQGGMRQPGGITLIPVCAAVAYSIDRPVGTAEFSQFLGKINPQAVTKSHLLLLDRNRCQCSHVHGFSVARHAHSSPES